MASHYQAVPPYRHQQKFRHDVKPLTQLSINRNDSPAMTSAKLFTCRSNINGNLLFPLEEKRETSPKPVSKIASWHDLLKYLKTQNIVKNLDIFNKMQKNYSESNRVYQTFPLKNKSCTATMTSFPCQSSTSNINDLQINNKKLELKSTAKYKNLKFPLKLSAGKNRFLCKNQSTNIIKKPMKLKNVKLQNLDTKRQENLEILRKIIGLENYKEPKKLKKFPCTGLLDTNKKNTFPLHDLTFTFYNKEKELQKFPEKLSPTLGKFPNGKQLSKDTLTHVLNPQFKEQFLIYNFQYFKENSENINGLLKFPCSTSLKYCNLKRFPLNNQIKEYNLFADKSKICLSNPEPASPLPTTACKGQHVSQVQDAQFLSIPTTFVHKQTPPQTTFAKTFYDADNDAYKLPAINATINNTRSNEVGLFEERIERIQDAIVALFKNIQNSFYKTHNVNEHDEKTNAINRDDDDNSVPRFALTPPTNSTTSVRNNERNLSNNNNNDAVHNKNIYDLGDLWHNASVHHGKIVESSDVRGTLDETVDYGVKNENQNSSTGSFLVKSEEQISPHTPLPHPLTESLSTSFERSEILPKITSNVLPLNSVNNSNDIKNLEVDISTKLRDFVINEKISTETEISDNKLSTKEENDMTITRLEENENTHLQSTENFVNSNKILLSGNTEIDEMKYEMNRAKGALPSTLKDSRDAGKYETLKTGNTNENYNRNISSNLTTRPSRDIKYSMPSLSATQRLTLKSENSQCPITNHPPPNILNASVASLSLSPSHKTLNTTNDVLGNRRPSLSSLRSTQSTSLLSQDLTRYIPSTNEKGQKTAISRGASIDSCLEDVLPERTRLRRQRRLRTQDTQDEPEDPIERLNRLKARISASLSEVKGVLKQYSTDGETESEIVNTAITSNDKEKQEEENKEKGPVTFRFVKRIRRRSIFPEEDEEKEREQKGHYEVDHQLKSNNTNSNDEGIQSTGISDSEKISKLEIDSNLHHNKEINKSLYTLKEEIPKSFEETSSQYKEKNKTETTAEEIQKDFKEDGKTSKVPITNNETPEGSQLKRDTTSDFKDPLCEDILVPVEGDSLEELSFHNEVKIEHNNHESNKIANANEQTLKIKEDDKRTLKGAIPKHSESKISTEKRELTSDAKTKIKKKVLLKPKDPSRRASLAAVEGSKIEPPLKVAIPAKIIRRPSDSEALVKKKLITTKINTSGNIEEVTPKPNIVKVKRTSTTSNVPFATAQTKLIEKEPAMTALNNQSNDRVKSTDDKKSINNDKNKDVSMPKESKNNNITSQTNVLLPTQLLIDEAASLKAKTIENSQLQSNQEQVQKQTQQQATIKSATTKLKSNELQETCGDGGAMLENLQTTAISLTKTTEPNGHQINREYKNAQQEDIHDLLQQETIIVKPSAIKQVEQVCETHLENDHNHLQQKKSLEQQQVVSTTDIVVVKKDDVSNNKVSEIGETKTKAPNSAHVVVCEYEHPLSFVEGEQQQSITHKTDTKAIGSAYISNSSTADSTQNTRQTVDESFHKLSEEVIQHSNTMPELQLAPAPVQTAEVSPKPEHHKKKIILKKIVRQASIDKTKKPEPDVSISKEDDQKHTLEVKGDITTQVPDLIAEKDESTEEISESTEISESSNSQGSEERAALQNDMPKKERKIKKKVIIKRQKRRLSIGDSFFHSTSVEEPQNAEIETLEKAIAYVSDDEEADSESKAVDEEANKKTEEEEEKQKKPLKSCIMHKEYNIGDEVLYAERLKKTQIKWRRGRIKERITSISYLLDIDGKDVSSHINYLKKFTGRKVSFGGKEYLEIDYEQLAEEEERAEKLKRRSYSIWNMV